MLGCSLFFLARAHLTASLFVLGLSADACFVCLCQLTIKARRNETTVSPNQIQVVLNTCKRYDRVYLVAAIGSRHAFIPWPHGAGLGPTNLHPLRIVIERVYVPMPANPFMQNAVCVAQGHPLIQHFTCTPRCRLGCEGGWRGKVQEKKLFMGEGLWKSLHS